MKAIIVFLSFVLFSINTQSFFCSAAEEPDAVLDIHGNALRTGGEYFVLPFIGFGGGLTVSSFENKTCPLSVIQGHEVERGLPITFTSVNPNEGIVRVSTDLNIKFSALTICIESNVWKVEYDESTGKYVILTNGVEGNPGPETFFNWFKIENYGISYKLVFCPDVCDYCKVSCKDVGIFLQEGKRRLALTDDAMSPLMVVFVDARLRI